MKTRITELLGIEYPIIAGAMAAITDSAEWVANFSNLGGLGILAAAILSPEGVRNNIRKIRELTDKPFGINLVPFAPRADEILEVMVDEKVPVFSYGRGDPTKSIHAALKAGSIAMPTVGRVYHALKAVKEGAAALIVTGSEGGGHTSFVGTMVLVPAVCKAVTVPLVAGGGITVPEQFAATLVLGADGIEMGTRLMATKESRVHNNVKQAFVKASEDETYSTCHISGHHLRGLLNKYRQQFVGLPESIKGENIPPGSPRFKKWFADGRRGMLDGDVENGAVDCGQGIGLIYDIPSVAEVIENMMQGVEPALDRAKALISGYGALCPE